MVICVFLSVWRVRAHSPTPKLLGIGAPYGLVKILCLTFWKEQSDVNEGTILCHASKRCWVSILMNFMVWMLLFVFLLLLFCLQFQQSISCSCQKKPCNYQPKKSRGCPNGCYSQSTRICPASSGTSLLLKGEVWFPSHSFP